MINPNIKQLIDPPIAEALSWINDYNGNLGTVIDMSQAVPDYEPDPLLVKYINKASLTKSLFNYGTIEGEEILRNEYANLTNKIYEANIKQNEILISSGCNQAFILTAITLANSGDEIMISNPGYFSYDSSLKMLGIKPRKFDLKKDSFHIDFSEIEKNFNKNVKGIIIVSPGNPTGAILSHQEIEKIFRFCQNKNIFLILDETYRDFIYPNFKKPHKIFNHQNWGTNLIHLYSFSKAYCIPGQRVGAIIANKIVIKEISKVMDNIQICAPRSIQHALGKYLKSFFKFQENKSEEIYEKSAYFQKLISQKTNWEILSIGGFFAYLKHPFKNINSFSVSKALAQECGLITLPGICFGYNQEKYLRFSFASIQLNEISEIPSRLKKLEKHFC